MNKIVATAFLIALSVFLPLAAQEDPYEQAKALLEKDDLKGAMPLLEKAIAAGNADAMVHFVFVSPDLEPGAKLALLLKAAEKENGIALFNLGHYFYRKDPAKAADFYKRAMAAGQPGAGTRYGLCCLSGYGVKKDHAAAKLAFQQDIAKNDPAAMNFCAVMMARDGEHEAAYALLKKAADAGFAPAINNLGILMRNGNKPEDRKAAFRYFTRAAHDDFPPAVRNLAMAYFSGLGTDVNYDAARRFAAHAARKGDAPAMHMLGMMDLYGYGKEKDPATAFIWYLMAAEKGYVPAMIQVAEMYQNGQGTKVDPATAEKWLALARKVKKTETPETLPEPEK